MKKRTLPPLAFCVTALWAVPLAAQPLPEVRSEDTGTRAVSGPGQDADEEAIYRSYADYYAEDEAEGDFDPSEDTHEIVVSATRPFGAVETDMAAIDRLDAEDVASYGADSVGDLIDALGPQIGSGRGRSGGRPVMLVNGRPVNSFREIRQLPPEAVKTVEIFPEELALKYGYRPDQRVVNLILVPGYASAEVEMELGAPGDGGRWYQEYEFGFTTIGQKSRFNANIEYSHEGAITYAERGIARGSESDPSIAGYISAPGGGEIDPALSAAAGTTVTQAALPGDGVVTLGDLAAGAGSTGNCFDGDYRSLSPRSQSMEAQASWSHQVSETGDLSLSGGYTVEDTTRYLGLQSVRLDVDAANPFLPLASDVVLSRLVPGRRGLIRDSETETIEASAGLNGSAGDWRWRLSSNASKVNSETRTERGVDEDSLQAAVDGGTLNPFSADFGASYGWTSPDTAESRTLLLSGLANASGPLFALPAGSAELTLTAGGSYNRIESDTRVDDVTSFSRLSRSIYEGSAQIDLPVADDGTGLGDLLGRMSVSANLGYSELSDFGSLVSYGGGLNWNIADNLDLNASFIGEEAAPSLSDLGAPVIVTPNSTVYDYTRGESALVDFVTGGNPALAKEKRRDIKITATWEPSFLEDLRITGEYLRNRSYDVTASFPELTPAVEAAFPGRVTRDPSGALVRLDARPVTYEETRNDALKLTLSWSAEIGADRQEARGGGGRAGGQGESGGRGERARGGGQPVPGMRGDRKGGRLRLSLGYEYKLKDEIVIAPGLPTLDLLNGDATGSNGGTPRHQVELQSNLFMNGWGLRVSADYESATRVDGDPLTGSSGLRFGDVVTVDTRLFVNLEELGLADAVPLFENARMSLRVDNVFDTYQKVRDENGAIPFRYSRAFVEPIGRYFEIDFRKRF